MSHSPSLERFLTYRLHLVSRTSDRESSAAYVDECGISLSDGRCLAAIGSFAPLSVRDLARRANQDKAQTSRSVKSLVALGLVGKAASDVDGRGVVLTLTPAGKRTYRKVMKMIAARNDAIFGALNAAERRTLGTLLDRVTAALGENAVRR
ncbi:MAG: MarR family winged helix-turn-helix transcriptional regulator [Burkholderiaceae bacterium]